MTGKGDMRDASEPALQAVDAVPKSASGKMVLREVDRVGLRPG